MQVQDRVWQDGCLCAACTVGDFETEDGRPLHRDHGVYSSADNGQSDSSAATTALILVPTRELADQVFKAIERLSTFCAKDIRAVKLTDKLSDSVQRSLLSASPDVVISTPARAWHNVSGNSSPLSLARLAHLVLDEADLLLSYGYDEDLENLAAAVPKGVQTIMMSATLTEEVDKLKGIFYKEGELELLDLEEPEAEGEGVTQLVTKYVVHLRFCHGNECPTDTLQCVLRTKSSCWPM